MTATCQSCGKAFEAATKRAKYCSATCRSRALRKREAIKANAAKSERPQLAVVGDDGARKQRRKPDGSRANHHKVASHEDVPASAAGDEVPSVLDAVKGRLAELSDLDWRKAACLRLAYRMDHSQMDTATALANLAAALAKQMDEVAPSEGEEDFLAAIGDRVAMKRRR